MKVHQPRSANQWLPLPALRRYAPSVAFGLKLRMPAAGPAHFLTRLPSKRLCERPANLIVGARRAIPMLMISPSACRLTVTSGQPRAPIDNRTCLERLPSREGSALRSRGKGFPPVLPPVRLEARDASSVRCLC